MSIRTGSEEVGDDQIEEYPLPEQIEQLIEAGKYSNVENRVTKVCVGSGGGGGRMEKPFLKGAEWRLFQRRSIF